MSQKSVSNSEYFEDSERPPEKELFPEKLIEFTSSLQEIVHFPVDILPKIIRDYVVEVAASRQVPIDLPAILALGAIAIPAMGKFHVYIGNTHDEPINIYAVCVMPPGARKSPTFKTSWHLFTTMKPRFRRPSGQ